MGCLKSFYSTKDESCYHYNEQVKQIDVEGTIDMRSELPSFQTTTSCRKAQLLSTSPTSKIINQLNISTYPGIQALSYKYPGVVYFHHQLPLHELHTVKINLDPNPDLSGLARSIQIDLDSKPQDSNPDLSGNLSC